MTLDAAKQEGLDLIAPGSGVAKNTELGVGHQLGNLSELAVVKVLRVSGHKSGDFAFGYELVGRTDWIAGHVVHGVESF
jgi:uncharacterized cupin superfamily protein